LGVTPREKQTADRVLDAAESLVQTRGYNAFSYADIARAVGIRKASLHHHFATKADLGVALVARYRSVFLGALDSIESGYEDAPKRLEQYTGLYGNVLRRGRMCMCGMLAADVATLPKAMRTSIADFFAENEDWLARVLAEGRKRGQIDFDGTPDSMAAFFVSSLEGAMLIARGSGNLQPFDDVVRRLLARVRPPRTRATRRK
jgi:TetR/AcrR family transcriptional regulator, transcriptional repressor for nem operon